MRVQKCFGSTVDCTWQRSRSVIMKLAAVVYVLVSTSSAHTGATTASIAIAGGGRGNCQRSGGNCSTITEGSGRWGWKRRSTGGDRDITQEAKGYSIEIPRKRTTEFVGWWRGLKRRPTSGDRSTTKRATGDSGRPTGNGENEGE